MELRQYLSVLRNRLWLILTAAVLAAGAGFFVSNQPARYEARSTIYVGSTSLDTSTQDLSSDRFAAIDRIVLTFSRMIDSEPVAERAISDTDLDRDAEDVVEQTSVTPEPATSLIYIAVRDEEAAVAQALSNALADAFVEEVQEFEPGDTEGSVPRLPAYVFERARLPPRPVPTGQILTIIQAGLFGLLGGIGLALLLDYLDVSLRTAADVERRLELPVLGVIPELSGTTPFKGGARQAKGGARQVNRGDRQAPPRNDD